MKLIKNALVSTGNGNETKLVSILFNDKILEISENPAFHKGVDIIDLQGKLLIPGCIDAHVHFNDPGFNHREDFLSGTTAAAYGGITTIIDMPCTSIPPVTNKVNLYKKLDVIQYKALIDFALWGGIRRNDFPLDKNIILELWNEGVIGFKLYTISGMETFEALSYEDIRKVLSELPGILFGFHSEDENKINNALKSLSKEELKLSENCIKTRPAEAEVEAVKNILEVIKRDSKIHFVHISSKRAAEMISTKKNFSDVTFETCPHFLQFTSEDIPKLKGRIKTTPIVKSEEDKRFLRSCLKEGKVDFITTDHAGCDYKKEKEFEDFSKVYNGIPGIELMIPFLFSEFYLNENVSLETMLKLTSENASKRFGLYPEKGSLKIETDADFTVIDIRKPFKVNEKKLHSLGKYSPFHKETFYCSIDKTIVRGEIVFDSISGIIQNPGYGKWIKRK